MMNTSPVFRLCSLTAALVALSVPLVAGAGVTGNVGVASQYIFRGGVENENTAVQGGIDASLPAGFYAGYWGSNLGDQTYATNAFENDIYGGWTKEFGPVKLDIGALYYLYSKDTYGAGATGDVLEPYVKVTFGPATLALHYFFDDVSWGNKGDIYTSLSASHTIGKVTLGAVAGFNLWSDDDAGNSYSTWVTTEDNGFRHLDLSASVPVTDKSVMSVTYVVGGTDRTGTDIANKLVLGFKYNFEIAK